jgi:hypothetical protein
VLAIQLHGCHTLPHAMLTCQDAIDHMISIDVFTLPDAYTAIDVTCHMPHCHMPPHRHTPRRYVIDATCKLHTLPHAAASHTPVTCYDATLPCYMLRSLKIAIRRYIAATPPHRHIRHVTCHMPRYTPHATATRHMPHACHYATCSATPPHASLP